MCISQFVTSGTPPCATGDIPGR